jgi:copper(I)-binding protein
MTLRFLSVFSAALLLAGAVHAHDYRLGSISIDYPHARPTVPRQPAGAAYRAGDISIIDPHARPTVAGQPGGAAYLTLENTGGSADRLVGVTSPVAQSAAVHTMRMDGYVMRMREAGELPLPPAAKVEMKPGHGYHIMLMGLKQPLKAGDKFPLTLNFEKAGKIEISVPVDSQESKPTGHAH